MFLILNMYRSLKTNYHACNCGDVPSKTLKDHEKLVVIVVVLMFVPSKEQNLPAAVN